MTADKVGVIVMGAGLLGRAVASAAAQRGISCVTVARTPRPGVLQGDLATPAGLAAVRQLVQDRPGCSVVLAHGPVDRDWCEEFPERAAVLHTTLPVALAGTDARVVLVSTDAVFAGDRFTYGDDETPTPVSAYGRAKVAAEEAVADLSRGSVLRVSLLYGWSPVGPQQRLNFAEKCLVTCAEGRVFEAPDDQFVTPLRASDAAETVLWLLTHEHPDLLHLGGPVRLSRAAFAATAAAPYGWERLVRPVAGAASSYASRPANSCLSTSGFLVRNGQLPVAPGPGLESMFAQRPSARAVRGR